MKTIFFFLLNFFLFVKILSNKQKQKLIEKETEIEETDSDIVDLTDAFLYPEGFSIPMEKYNETGPSKPEVGPSTAEDSPINIDKPVSTKPKNKDKKNAKINLMKIHNYSILTPEKIGFNIHFYYFGKPIANYIILRLRVNNRQEKKAYSVRADCINNKHYKNLFENELYGIQGEYANYNCQALTIFGLRNIEVILNSDVPITIVYFNKGTEQFDFTGINFNGDASEESSNIQKNTINLEKYGTLENTEVFVDNNKTLVFRGEINPQKTLDNVKRIKMLLMNQENGEIITKNYFCNIILISKPIYEIICDISESYIITTINNLHLSTGTSVKGKETEEGVFLTIDLKNGLNNKTEVIMNPVKIYYRKSSDGLSGGAITGIVIAGVAVIATIITIVLIKKNTKPPVNNTTFINLKTDPNKIDSNKIDHNKIEPNRIAQNKIEPSKIQQEKSDLKINYDSNNK